MKSNDMLLPLDVIKRDLSDTRKLLLESAFSGHQLLADQTCQLVDLPLATLLLVAASFGDYCSKELKPVAAGLELLRLAVEKHYCTEANEKHGRNLFLVTADYFYAQAISLATRLKKGFVVEYMVKAIADIAEAESSGSKDIPDDKSTSLFKTAAKLGIRLSECPKSHADHIIRFASILGQSNQDKERAASALKLLPAPQGRLLENLISIQFC